jgi:hypothetical protein
VAQARSAGSVGPGIPQGIWWSSLMRPLFRVGVTQCEFDSQSVAIASELASLASLFPLDGVLWIGAAAEQSQHLVASFGIDALLFGRAESRVGPTFSVRARVLPGFQRRGSLVRRVVHSAP